MTRVPEVESSVSEEDEIDENHDEDEGMKTFVVRPVVSAHVALV